MEKLDFEARVDDRITRMDSWKFMPTVFSNFGGSFIDPDQCQDPGSPTSESSKIAYPSTFKELMSPLDNQAQSKRRDFPYGVVSLNYGSMDNEYKWVETRDESMLQVAMRKRSFDSFQAPSGGHSSGNGLSCCEDQFGPGDSVRDLIPQSFYSNAYMMGQNDYNFSGENCNDLGDNNIYKARQVPIPSTDICTPPPRLPSTNLNVLRHTKPITVGAALENLQRVRSARKNRGSPSPGGPIQMTSQVNFFAGPLLMRGSPGPASPAVTTPQPGPHAESPAQREGKRRKQEDGSPAKGFPVEAPPVEGSPARGSPAGGYPAEGYPVEGSSGEGSPAPGLASLLAVSASQAVTVPQDVPAPLAVPARPVSAKTPPAKAPGKALARTRPSSAASVQSDPGSHSHLESEISDLSGPQASDKSRKETGKKGVQKCVQCGAHQTPQWRSGPAGSRTLCNACGVRYTKVVKTGPTDKPAPKKTSRQKKRKSASSKHIVEETSDDEEVLGQTSSCDSEYFQM